MLKQKFILLFIFLIIFSFVKTVDAYYVRYNESILSTTNFNQSLNITNITNFNAQVLNETWLDFNGTNDNVDFGNAQSLNTSNNFTISIWLKGNNVTGGTSRYILTKGTTNSFEWSLHTNISNMTNFIIFTTTGTNYRLVGSTTALVLNKWYHVMVATNDTNTSLYVNGKIEGSNSIATGVREIDGIAKVMAGTRQTVGSNKLWNGSIDDIRIYSSSLSKQQARRFYNESVHGSALGLGIPVLSYHQIRDPNVADTVVNLTNFADQMAWLNSSGYTTITYNNFTNWTKGLEKLPNRPIILVFDDGWSSVYYNATPIMDNYSFIGVAGIIMDRPTGTLNYMNWTEIANLSSKGWQIASHSMNHTSLLLYSLSERAIEFNNSRYAIFGNISYLPNTWIYPFNANNDTIDTECATFYTICSGSGSSVTTLENFLFKNANLTHENGNPIGIRRIIIENETSMAEFIEAIDYNLNIVLDQRFDENEGSITYDRSGYGNNGAITGSRYNTTGVLINIFNVADYILSNIHGFFNLITNNYNRTQIQVNYNATPIVINYTGFPQNISIEMYSLNDALVFYSNNTALCTNIASCDNNINTTISNATNLYILDTFNFTENTNRQFSPIWLTSSSPILKTIASNITQNINFTAILNPYPKLCSQIKSVSERSNSGNFTRTLVSGIDYTCMSDLINISLQNVEYSTGSHEIVMNYLGDSVCDVWEDGFSIDCNPTSSPGGGNTGGPTNASNINNTLQLQTQIHNNIQNMLDDLNKKPYFKYVSFAVVALIIISALNNKYKKRDRK